eukprot:CAMPEP_0119058092 /NCGR_PEP_ID=MMETSP1178-20130426/2450_1 /TAXON_ID=33656 /ORGANISM="unid sp, Strain CCMP2000" /LENGTH=150 /DNA_ID=CAMNT_0007038987 /DNA_START=116 /DNA_END=569 /DNA_ORIENTATION=+
MAGSRIAVWREGTCRRRRTAQAPPNSTVSKWQKNGDGRSQALVERRRALYVAPHRKVAQDRSAQVDRHASEYGKDRTAGEGKRLLHIVEPGGCVVEHAQRIDDGVRDGHAQEGSHARDCRDKETASKVHWHDRGVRKCRGCAYEAEKVGA